MRRKMFHSRSVLCCFCGCELFDELDAAVEYKHVYIVQDLQFSEFWFDGDCRVRCGNCDSVIGTHITNIPNFMIVWCVRLEDEYPSEFENIHAVQFLERFAEVC